MTLFTIYRATNTINGKCYVGFDSDWPRRQFQHLRARKYSRYSKHVFYKALNKYGPEVFVWDVLYQTEDKDLAINQMETHYILENHSFYRDNGYNMTMGGTGPKAAENRMGKKHSEETRAKLRAAWDRRKARGDTGTFTGRKHKPESIVKMKTVKRKISDDFRRACSDRNRRRYEDPEAREKMREVARRGWDTRRKNAN